MKNIDSIVTLLKQYMGGEISPTTNPELQRLIEQYPIITDIRKEVKDEEARRKSLSSYILYTEKELLQIEDNIIAQIHAQRPSTASSIRTIGRSLWKSLLTAAAAIIFVFLTGYWLWNTSPSSNREHTTGTHAIAP